MDTLLAIITLVTQLNTTPNESVSFAVGGDIMLTRSVGSVFAKDGYRSLLSDFDTSIFSNVDVPFANLEGAISDKEFTPKAIVNNLTFIFPKKSLNVLSQLHLRAVSLANNHSLNGGVKGVDLTRQLLRAKEITPFGDPRTSKNTHITSFQGNGLTLHLIGIHALSKKDFSRKEIIENIKVIKKDDKSRVIVYPHWGIEYAKTHSPYQQELAREWIDAGADAVIGAHPHVVQDIEVYKNRPIIYSLGNFIFDQTFSKETQIGLIVSGVFTPQNLEISLIPIQSRKLKPSIMTGKERQGMLEKLLKPIGRYKKDTKEGAILQFNY